jgi:hypothetical protein
MQHAACTPPARVVLRQKTSKETARFSGAEELENGASYSVRARVIAVPFGLSIAENSICGTLVL